jgi:hypothetical protein
MGCFCQRDILLAGLLCYVWHFALSLLHRDHSIKRSRPAFDSLLFCLSRLYRLFFFFRFIFRPNFVKVADIVPASSVFVGLLVSRRSPTTEIFDSFLPSSCVFSAVPAPRLFKIHHPCFSTALLFNAIVFQRHSLIASNQLSTPPLLLHCFLCRTSWIFDTFCRALSPQYAVTSSTVTSVRQCHVTVS